MNRRDHFFGLLMLTAAMPISARATGLELSGIVTESLGHPLNRAVITLESLDTKTRLTTTTGADGLYRFARPPEGAYSLRAEEPDHLFAIYGPLVIGADSSVVQNVQLDRPRFLGRDPVSCDRSLISGRVEGLRKTSPAIVQFCMRGARGHSCTHLGPGATIALYVLPGMYELSLEGPGQQRLVSHSIDVSYCGEYEGKIVLVQ